MPTGAELWAKYHKLADQLFEAFEKQQYARAWKLNEQRINVQRTLIEIFGTQPRVFAATEQKINDRLLEIDEEVVSHGK